MTTMTNVRERSTAAAEWRLHWPLVIAALLGYSTNSFHTYGMSVFVPHLEQAFSWTRSQVLMGVSIAVTINIILAIPVGFCVDRFGSRPVALIGLCAITGGLASLGTASGDLIGWSLLWGAFGIGLALVQSTIWSRPLAQCFDRSRGLALALALSGTSVAAIILPPLSTFLITNHGWRDAFMWLGAGWLAVTSPLIFIYFRERSATIRNADPRNVPTADERSIAFRAGLRSRALYCLMISFAAFSFFAVAMATNLVPMIQEAGFSQMQAAGAASAMGIVALIARLSAGVLLDRFQGHIVGTIMFTIPMGGAALLIGADSHLMAILAAVIGIGVALGAEIDVVLYLASRHFGIRAFATLFGVVLTVGQIGAAAGPYIAGLLHDHFGSYDALLLLLILILGIGAAATASLGPEPDTK